jgi:hypothetical protein
MSQIGMSFKIPNSWERWLWEDPHLDKSSAPELFEPFIYWTWTSQLKDSWNSHRFLTIACSMLSVPLPELQMLTATLLSHQTMTLLLWRNLTQVFRATRILRASQSAIDQPALLRIGMVYTQLPP